MANKVMMPVECLDKLCMHCPELEITTDQTEVNSGDAHFTINYLKCVHLDKCLNIYHIVKKDWVEGHVTRLEHRSI